VTEATGAAVVGRVATPSPRAHWGAFALVCLAYLAVTTGEQGLSPVMPSISEEFGTSEGQSGLAFGLLALSIALANVVAGAVIGRFGAKALMVAGLAATAAGAVAAAVSPNFAVLVVAQLLLGAGAGLYFPAGLQGVTYVSGPGRRGLAMGLYGVAFSGGLLAAALLGALGAASGWRIAFWCAAGLAVAALVATTTIPLPPPTGDPVVVRFPRKAVAGLPAFIGGIAAICQYGAIPFLTTFAVDEWGLKAAQAAALLAVGRVLSIVAKLISGAGMDRSGPIVGARWTGFIIASTGLAWVLLPAGWPAYVLAAVFAGSVSSLGPIANFVAVEQFGSDGPALGAFRSTQIGIGAAAGWLIGGLGEVIGLRPTLLVAVLSPLLLVACLGSRTAVAPDHA
jgi:predicted MFS family arabinose efflux permease